MSSKNVNDLPEWAQYGFEGAPESGVLNKREDSRHTWVDYVNVCQPDCPADQVSIKTLNISQQGVGFVSRQAFHEDDILHIFPDECPEQPLKVRVVHCTQTIAGFKVGCAYM